MRALLGSLSHSELRAGALQIGERGDQVVLRLHELASMDDKKRSAGLDDVAEDGDDFDDPSGIMREYRRRQIVIDCNSPFGHLLRNKGSNHYGLKLETMPLLLGRTEGSRG